MKTECEDCVKIPGKCDNCPDKPEVASPVDAVVKSRVIATTKPVEPYLVCPNCGEYPLRLSGKKTLALPRNCKATCDYCNYEEGF